MITIKIRAHIRFIERTYRVCKDYAELMPEFRTRIVININLRLPLTALDFFAVAICLENHKFFTNRQ